MRFFLTFATITCLIVIASCTKDIGANPDLAPKQPSFCDTVTFAKHIKPIFDNNCVTCHQPGGQSPDLSTYALIKPQVDGGRIYARVIAQNPSVMPPSGALP